MNVHFDPVGDGQTIRDRLYAGDLVIMSATPESLAFINWAREMIEEAFAPYDPQTAQFHLDLHDFADRLSALKPRFIHHPRTWELMRALVMRHVSDPIATYLDVPRLRGISSDGYLTSGPGYAFDKHRDTWWSAPMQQINWWLPIYSYTSDSAMAFHPECWDRPVENSSGEFDYYDWNLFGRAQSSQNVTKDTRVQPKIVQDPRPDFDFPVTPVVPEGGIITFSGQHMHSSIPNTSGLTRFSIDFRTVNIVDVRNGKGAPNADSHPRGTSLRDFRRCIDREAMPEELALSVDPRIVDAEAVVFKPQVLVQSLAS